MIISFQNKDYILLPIIIRWPKVHTYKNGEMDFDPNPGYQCMIRIPVVNNKADLTNVLEDLQDTLDEAIGKSSNNRFYVNE